MLIKCIGDIIRAGASLRVTCRNCSRERFIKARHLAARFGSGYLLEELQPKFRCTGCQSQNTRLGLALPDLAEENSGP